MIRTFRHKGLARLFNADDPRGVQAQHRKRITRILDLIDAAEGVEELQLPGYDLHPLKGNRSGHWSMKVSGNWRITFRFAEGDAHDVHLEDYH